MENDKDVIEFRIAKDYLDFEDWMSISRSLGLADNTIANIRARQDLHNFKDRMYESLYQWKQFCPEISNIEELVKALKKENLNGPASKIEVAIKSFRDSDRGSKAVLQWKQICRETSNTDAIKIYDAQLKEESVEGPVEVIDEVTDETTDEGPVDVPVTDELTCAESVATVAKPLKRIKVGSSDVSNVAFSHDGVWFSTVEKGSHVKIWEWATLSIRFQRKLDVVKIYDVNFNDWVSGSTFGGVHDTEVCILVCNIQGNSIERLSVYKVEAGMPLVCETSSTPSITFGSWFKRDQFLSGTTDKGSFILCLRRICYREAAKRAALPSNEIVRRNDIRNAKLLKTFQNNMLLCFKTGRNLEVIHVKENQIINIQSSDCKLFKFEQRNVGFFKLSSDLRNLFVLMDKEGHDIHQFLIIEVTDLKYTTTTVNVHIQGPFEYSDFGVTGGNIILGSCQNKTYFTFNLESKKCVQKLLHKSNLCSVACHPTDQKAVVTSDRGGNVLVWNMDDTIMK